MQATVAAMMPTVPCDQLVALEFHTHTRRPHVSRLRTVLRKSAWSLSFPRGFALQLFFFWLVAAWVKSRAERPSDSVVNRQLHVQIGCKLGIRNRKDELTKQAKRNKLQIRPEGN